MKRLFLLTVLMLGSTSLAQANDLPMVKNVTIKVAGGGGFAAVQPSSSIHFTINSCAERRVQAQTSTSANGTVMVSIVDLDRGDCRAVAVDRQYTLQISHDATGESYVLLNPIEPGYLR